MTKKLTFLAISVLGFFGLTNVVQAQGFLPQQIKDIFALLGTDGALSASFVTSRAQTALLIALGGVVLVAVIYALIAAFKYIQSQGDPGKIEEAQKAIKAIFLGVAAMLIAIVGIILVFVFFNAGTVDPSLFQTCISAPNSAGCTSCKNDGSDVEQDPTNVLLYTGTDPCATCESQWATYGANGTPNPGPECLDPNSPLR